MQNLSFQLLLQNMPGLNPKSFRSAFVVKSYVLLIAIRLSDGDVKPDGPLVLFNENRLMSAPIFLSFLTSHS